MVVVTIYTRRTFHGGDLFARKLILPKELQDHKLINDVPIWWNSTYGMLKRLTEQMPALRALAMDQTLKIKNIKSLLYDFEDQKMVEELTVILEQFKTTTTLLSGEESVSLTGSHGRELSMFGVETF